MLLVIVPLALLLLVAGGMFLYFSEKERARPVELLTADKVFPTEEDLVPNRQAIILRQRERLKEAEGAGVLGEKERQREILEELVGEPMPPLRAVLTLAQIERDSGNAARAIEVVEEGLARSPSAPLYFARGMLHLDAGETDQAIAAFTMATEEQPGRAVFENARLLAQLSGGMEEEVAAAITTRREFDLAALRDTWVMADAALQARRGEWVMAAEYLRQGKSMLPPSAFAALLRFPALAEFKDRPELAFYFAGGRTDNFSFREAESEPTVGP